MDNQKLYEALKTIKEACREHKSKCEACMYCPLASNYGECHITPDDEDIPAEWNVVEPEKAVRLLQ